MSVATEETTDLDAQDDASASPRQIGNGAQIATVNASRTARAEGTLCRSAGCAQTQTQACICDEHMLKAQTTQMGQQGKDKRRDGHGNPSEVCGEPHGMPPPEFYRTSLQGHRI
jgi:hypothetical protein